MHLIARGLGLWGHYGTWELEGHRLAAGSGIVHTALLNRQGEGVGGGCQKGYVCGVVVLVLGPVGALCIWKLGR